MQWSFENILLAFDNSNASKIALQKTCDFASKFNSKITALFVSSEGSLYFANSKKYLVDFTSSKNLTLEIIEVTGKIYDEVIKREKTGKYSLILLGSHITSGTKPFLRMGAFKVINNSICPVITFREESQVLDLQNILVPLADFRGTRQKVPYCAELAKAFGSTVHIYGVSKHKSGGTTTRINSYIRQTERYLAERGIKYTVSSDFGVDVPRNLISYGEEIKAGLLVIMTESESAGLFKSSYSQQLVKGSTIPVMSINSKDTRLAGASGY